MIAGFFIGVVVTLLILGSLCVWQFLKFLKEFNL